mgnify:FL=1|jgi:exodeoxyribonuclease VII small subunit
MFKNISDEEIKKLTFEDSYKKLEEIVKTLENKDSSLEESIDYYDLGVRLKNHCDEKLKVAELKIKRLSNKEKLEELI